MKTMEQKENLVINGRTNTWYVIGEREYEGNMYYLLENEEYGDEAEWIVVNADGIEICDECWNGWDDFEYAIETGAIYV